MERRWAAQKLRGIPVKLLTVVKPLQVSEGIEKEVILRLSPRYYIANATGIRKKRPLKVVLATYK